MGKRRIPRYQRDAEPTGRIPADPSKQAPNNSYSPLEFYEDTPFVCVDCGKEEVWTGSQQKWWYEIAKGFVYSSAVRCRACRRKEQARRNEARRVHLEGIARKNQTRMAKKAEKSS